METPRSSAPEKARPAGGPPKPIDAVLAEFARRLGADRYDVWFRNAARVDLAEDGVIEVRVPNSFIGRFLEERCAALLRACGAQVLGVEPQARFVVDGDTFPARPPSAAGAAAAEPSRPAARANAGRSRMLAGTAQGRRFSLAEFVVGPGTRMAHAAALRVAESPGKAFNPLFIHGKVGLGKTHLLLGIAAALAERRPELETLYTSAEEFTNVFLAAMKAGALDRFRREVRSLDVLILDDIHFFSKKHATQEEFLHTFNSIEAEGRQIVLASDSPPRELAEFSARLVNRFVQGMVAAVEPPDFATRRNILSAKLGRLGRKLSDDALDRLADVAPPNVRELEGVLTTYLAHLDIEGRSPDAGTVYELFAVAGAPAPAGASAAARIEQAVADLFGVKPSDLAGTRRGNGLNHARQMLMYLLRERTNWTLQQIADHLGRKNHTTVLMGHRRMQDAIDADEPVPLPGCPKDGLPGAKAVMERIAAALSNGSAPMRANGA